MLALCHNRECYTFSQPRIIESHNPVHIEYARLAKYLNRTVIFAIQACNCFNTRLHAHVNASFLHATYMSGDDA